MSRTRWVIGAVCVGGSVGALAFLLWRWRQQASSKHADALKSDALHAAIAAGDDVTTTTLAHFASPAAIAFAVQRNTAGILHILLSERADLAHACDDDGMPAVILASMYGRTDCLRVLLAHGADMSVEDASGLTAAHMAAKYGHTACLQLLAGIVNIARRSDGCTPLMLAAGDNKHAAVAWLAEHGGGVDDALRPSGVTALMAAAQRDHVMTLTVLLKHGATVDAVAGDGRTALAIAAQHNAVGAVATLLLHRARATGAFIPPFARGATGETSQAGQEEDPVPVAPSASAAPHNPLAAADAAAALVSALDALNQARALPPHADVQPLVLAALRGHVDVVQLLLDAGASAHTLLSDGRSLLLAMVDLVARLSPSAPSRFYDVLRLLLAAGAHPNHVCTQHLEDCVTLNAAGETMTAPAVRRTSALAASADSGDDGLRLIFSATAAAGR